MRRGIFVAPFDELSHPRVVAELAASAEERGFDGFFVWDHIQYSEPVREVADPWVTLSAVALPRGASSSGRSSPRCRGGASTSSRARP